MHTALIMAQGSVHPGQQSARSHVPTQSVRPRTSTQSARSHKPSSLEAILLEPNATLQEHRLFVFNTESRCTLGKEKVSPEVAISGWGRRNYSLPSAVVQNASQPAGPEMALNPLEGVLVHHHPVMRALLPLLAYPMRPDHIMDLGGLLVPRSLDCEDADKASGIANYQRAVPSRWLACSTHQAAVDSGLPLAAPNLPMIDEEYSEHTAIFQSVLRAPAGPFAIAELGARWACACAHQARMHAL